MDLRTRFQCVAVGGLLALASTSSFAAVTTYFSDNPEAVDGSGNPTAVGTAAAAQQGTFLGLLTNVSTDNFNAYTVGKTPPTSLLGGLATLSASAGTTFDAIETAGSCDADFGCQGRYNTSGDTGGNYFQTIDSFTMMFSGGISAFGAYLTDLGDFAGTLTIDLLDSTGKALYSTAVTPTNGTGDGSLAFWGFTDDSISYAGIRFNITQCVRSDTNPDCSPPDAVGFDDFVVGALPTSGGGGGNVPEPASLALVATALVGLQATRLRRS